MSRNPLVLTFACVCLLLASAPAHAQFDLKAVVVKHLTTSRDFTLKVAEQMPDGDYGFKLTPPQMSFGEQMAHLASDQANLLAPFTNAKPAPSKPASMNKKDVIAFVRQSFDQSIALVSKLTPAQIERSYPGFGSPMTGLELLMFVLDHSTHHRASAEMYLRAKGIAPAEYEF
ncbi:MAG TPA: DinB family protein [Vicinamibacterales bacterium]|jgi:uncharacterized damage-inducible protein DinB|nr:DinB family protein [Vicinamibacterales bacterium]